MSLKGTFFIKPLKAFSKKDSISTKINNNINNYSQILNSLCKDKQCIRRIQ